MDREGERKHIEQSPGFQPGRRVLKPRRVDVRGGDRLEEEGECVREGPSHLGVRIQRRTGKNCEDGHLALPFFDYHQAGQSRKKSKSKSATDKFCFPKELLIKH